MTIEETDMDKQQIEELLRLANLSRDKRAELMPDEESALRLMFEAYQRLKELGWKEIDYCPKDGSVFRSISAGSTGIHPAQYEGKWPDGHWWLHEAGDLWPGRPILWKPEKG
jgi:hypothetical protein